MPTGLAKINTIKELEILSLMLPNGIYHEKVKVSQCHNRHFNQHHFVLGSLDSALPTIIFVGGVHGVEKIGAQLVFLMLKHYLDRLHWDKTLNYLINKVRIGFVPLVNPEGYFSKSRSNGNGVDLMRNAPIDAIEPVNMLLGGHRFSRLLPWYRGQPGKIEAETRALINFIINITSKAPFTLVIDVHSGFGFTDRIWFPKAQSKQPIAHIAQLYALKTKLDRHLPFHHYLVEPQSRHYLTHGDIWDYLYEDFQARQQQILPLTLEIGSWRWLKQSLFHLNTLALFNPPQPKGFYKVIKKHSALFEFCIQLSVAWEHWFQLTASQRKHNEKYAKQLWYHRS